jgi:8-oxo-dGTP diphosphatase
VAHFEVARAERLASRLAGSTRLVPVDTPGRLPYDHAEIIACAVDDIRGHYPDLSDHDRLLGEEFTPGELRFTREAIAGHELQRDTFLY